MDPRDAADRLWDAAGPDGAVWRAGLPRPVLRAMQQIVDECVWQCEHIEAAADLPPAAVAKMAVAGGRHIACLALPCLGEMHDLSYLAQNRSCIMCGGRPVTYRPMFSDEASGLSILAWCCYGCAQPGGPLAAWAGVPD